MTFHLFVGSNTFVDESSARVATNGSTKQKNIMVKYISSGDDRQVVRYVFSKVEMLLKLELIALATTVIYSLRKYNNTLTISYRLLLR